MKLGLWPNYTLTGILLPGGALKENYLDYNNG